VRGEKADDVVVHDVGKEGQKKDEAHLNESLLEGETKIAAANAFEGEEQDVSSIKNRDREKIQDAKVDANEGHEQDRGGGAEGDGFTRGARNANHALQILNRNATTEKSRNDAYGIGNESTGLCEPLLEGIDDAERFVRNLNIRADSNLVDLVAGLGGTDFGSDGKCDGLAVAGNFHLKGLATGLVDDVDELIPIINLLAIYGDDQVAIFHARQSCWFARNGLEDFRSDWGIAEYMVVRILLSCEIELASDAIILCLDFQYAPRGERVQGMEGLTPSGIFDILDRNNLVADL